MLGVLQNSRFCDLIVQRHRTPSFEPAREKNLRTSIPMFTPPYQRGANRAMPPSLKTRSRTPPWWNATGFTAAAAK